MNLYILYGGGSDADRYRRHIQLAKMKKQNAYKRKAKAQEKNKNKKKIQAALLLSLLPIGEVFNVQTDMRSKEFKTEKSVSDTVSKSYSTIAQAQNLTAPNATITQAQNLTAPNATIAQAQNPTAPNVAIAQAQNLTAPNATIAQAQNPTAPNVAIAQAQNLTAPNATIAQAQEFQMQFNQLERNIANASIEAYNKIFIKHTSKDELVLLEKKLTHNLELVFEKILIKSVNLLLNGYHELGIESVSSYIEKNRSVFVNDKRRNIEILVDLCNKDRSVSNFKKYQIQSLKQIISKILPYGQYFNLIYDIYDKLFFHGCFLYIINSNVDIKSSEKLQSVSWNKNELVPLVILQLWADCEFGFGMDTKFYIDLINERKLTKQDKSRSIAASYKGIVSYIVSSLITNYAKQELKKKIVHWIPPAVYFFSNLVLRHFGKDVSNHIPAAIILLIEKGITFLYKNFITEKNDCSCISKNISLLNKTKAKY